MNSDFQFREFVSVMNFKFNSFWSDCEIVHERDEVETLTVVSKHPGLLPSASAREEHSESTPKSPSFMSHLYETLKVVVHEESAAMGKYIITNLLLVEEMNHPGRNIEDIKSSVG